MQMSGSGSRQVGLGLGVGVAEGGGSTGGSDTWIVTPPVSAGAGVGAAPPPAGDVATTSGDGPGEPEADGWIRPAGPPPGAAPGGAADGGAGAGLGVGVPNMPCSTVLPTLGWMSVAKPTPSRNAAAAIATTQRRRIGRSGGGGTKWSGRRGSRASSRSRDRKSVV